MLKTIKKQIPATRISRKTETTSIKRKERAIPKTRLHDPIEISKRLNRNSDHFIIYPTPAGYRFTLFSRIEDNDPFDIIAVSHKAYKLKAEAIKVMKRMLRSLGMASMSYNYVFAFDHKYNKISLKIEYDVKMLL